jgi:hypothetical protein
MLRSDRRPRIELSRHDGKRPGDRDEPEIAGLPALPALG